MISVTVTVVRAVAPYPYPGAHETVDAEVQVVVTQCPNPLVSPMRADGE